MGELIPLARGAMAFDGSAFAALEAHAQGLRLALITLFLAGLSSALGQSLVLVANRVRPTRFVASLLLSATLFVLTAAFWSTSLWVLAARLFDAPRPLATAVRTVGLAHAPQTFAFVVLVPYFGSGLGVALSVWTFLAIGVGARATFGLPLDAALASAALGWLLLQVLQRTVGRPVVAFTRRLRGWTAGRILHPLRDAHRSEREDAP